MADTHPLRLWLTDRSRYTTGTGKCRRERYLNNHFGPTGYGITRKAEALPLATGTYTHKALDPIFSYLRDHDQLPPDDYVRAAIAAALTLYHKKIERRGYAGILAGESTDRTIVEQQCLITGMVWAFVRLLLPWIHQNYRILEVEREGMVILDCTCGLGFLEQDPWLHDARDCQGIGQMLRQDCIGERRIGGGLAYFENKTSGWAPDNWASQWETRPQLSIGSFGIRERLQKEVVEHFVFGLYKGSRKSYDDPFEGTIYRQESAFCYGYCEKGNPPLATDDWVPAYEWVNENGDLRRKKKAHTKRGIWELKESDWPELERATLLGIDPVEWWVREFLPVSIIEKAIFVVGPLNRQDQQIAALKTEIPAEEHDWQRRLWELYELAQTHPWPAPEYLAALDRLLPRSWDCRRFGARNECQFKPICFQESGWDDPLGSGKFVPRRPHHQPELEQAIARGLLPEQSEEDEDEEDR